MYYTVYAFSFSDEPPKVTNNPKNLSKVSPGKPMTFTAEGTGTEPLSYHWEWKPAEEESKEWQPCHAEWCDGATLTIPNVQECNEGSYRCVISNYGGSQASISANLSVGKNPTNIISKATAEEESEEWQPYHAEWCDGATLTIPSVQKSSEGSYRCVISNYAGSAASNPAKLEVS